MGRTRVKNERDFAAIGIQYARDVVSGAIPNCQWVRAACQRHLDDLEKPGKWTFDYERAAHICRFAEMLPHVKGRWASPTFILEPWQCFVLTSIFGWVDENGLRRFRKALIVLPRKNGKSALASIVGLYGLALDHEPGAEIFAAATTRDQAKIVWDVSRRMVQKTPRFCEVYGVSPLAHSITVESTGSSFKPLSRDADSLEGLNPHFAIIDELHAHSVREVFDVLDEATGARRQPLMFIISTEGDNPTGVFAEQVAYAQQILEGRHSDDSYFAAIYTIDPEDDWVSPAAWRKANPNLGVSVFESDLEIRCRQAEKNPASQSSFLTKRLNVRVGAGEAFFNMLAWKQLCYEPMQIEDFYGKPCIIALDLASKHDIAASILYFRRGSDRCVFGRFYVPGDSVERGNPNYDFYRGWADRGFLTLTEGNVIDFEFIKRDLLEDCRNFSVTQVGFDPFQATQLSTEMKAVGLPMLQVPQTVRQMSEPMKEIAGLIMQGRLKHDGNPVLGWMLGNCVAKTDAKENVYPRKTRAENKIDGAVALIMAAGVDAVVQPIRGSIYNDPLTCAV